MLLRWWALFQIRVQRNPNAEGSSREVVLSMHDTLIKIAMNWVPKWANTKIPTQFFLRNLRGIPWSLPRLMFQANKSLPPPLVLLTGLESLANRLMISRASLAKNPPSNPAGAFIKPRIILVMKLWVPPLRCVVLKESTWND